jgi:asparagine synthetase B (glutamine-hydrolysing)
VEDVHPFAVEDMYLAHNGLLLNHQQFPMWQLFPGSEVDSQYILGGIQAHQRQGLPTVAAICATVSQLEGQQACWLWSQEDRALFLWRVMSPIYYSLTNVSFSFSSSRYQLTCAERSVRIETLLPEGVIFRLNPFTLTFEQVATFSYYSPYRI